MIKFSDKKNIILNIDPMNICAKFVACPYTRELIKKKEPYHYYYDEFLDHEKIANYND